MPNPDRFARTGDARADTIRATIAGERGMEGWPDELRSYMGALADMYRGLTSDPARGRHVPESGSGRFGAKLAGPLDIGMLAIAPGGAKGRPPVRASKRSTIDLGHRLVEQPAQPAAKGSADPALWPGGAPGRSFRYAPEKAQSNALAEAARGGDPKSLEMLRADLGTALNRITRRFGKPDLPTGEKSVREADVSTRDLRNVGEESLLKTLASYDPSGRADFIDYFLPKARRDIGRAAVSMGRPVSKAGYETDATGKAIFRVVDEYEKRFGAKPSNDYIRIKLAADARAKGAPSSLTTEDIAGYREGKRAVKGASLDAPLDPAAEAKGKPARSAIEGVAEPSPSMRPDTALEQKEGVAETGGRMEQIRAALSKLDAEDQAVLLQKFSGTTETAAAKALGLTRTTYQRRAAAAQTSLEKVLKEVPPAPAPAGAKPLAGGSDGPRDPNALPPDADNPSAFEVMGAGPQVNRSVDKATLAHLRAADQTAVDRSISDYARFVMSGDPRPGREPDPNLVRQFINPNILDESGGLAGSTTATQALPNWGDRGTGGYNPRDMGERLRSGAPVYTTGTALENLMRNYAPGQTYKTFIMPRLQTSPGTEPKPIMEFRD